MAVWVNRGNKYPLSPRFFQERQERRERRAEYRRTHRIIGWQCPFCEQQQMLEYPTQHRHKSDPLPTKPRWMSSGLIEVRCATAVRNAERQVIAECGLLSRVAITEQAGNPHAEAWLRWTRARWAHETLTDQREEIADGYRADPETWERGAGLLAVRFCQPHPPPAKLDAIRGEHAVTPLEARESTLSIVTLWLPSGHVRVPVVTSYHESGRHYVELDVPLPWQDDLRQDLLQLLDEEDRERHDAENLSVYIRSPYGTGPYCWSGKLETPAHQTPAHQTPAHQTPAAAAEEDIGDEDTEDLPAEQMPADPAPADIQPPEEIDWSALDEFLDVASRNV